MKDFSKLTQDQANTRFDMIGEFEEEMLKLSDMMSKQCLNGSLKKLDYNLNNMTSSERDVDAKLSEIDAEAKALGEHLGQLGESCLRELKDIQENCKGAIEDVASKFDLLSKKVDFVKKGINLSLSKRNNLLMSQK